MNYRQFKSNFQEKINKFEGLFFAFNNEQLSKGLEKFGVNEKEILSLGAGGFILKSKSDDYKNLFKTQEEEIKEKIKDHSFFKSLIIYELHNHEAAYTGDLQDTLEAIEADINMDIKDLDDWQKNLMKEVVAKHMESEQY